MQPPNSPRHVRTKANILIKKFKKQQITPRRTYRRGYLTLFVTPGWRLLSKDDGKSWLLLSHADYDKLL